MMPESEMHVTIQQGTSVPELEKCNTCCSMYHCPFCQPAWFKPTYYCKVKDHVEGHFNRAVSHEGYTIHRCGLQCRPKLHFHCIYCCGIIMRRVPFINHLRMCKEKHPALMVSAAAAQAPASAQPTAVSPFVAPPTAAHPSASPPSSGPSTAGPSTAGPSTAGPSTAGPSTAGPSTAGPSTAGPFTAGPFTAGPFTAGPFTAGPFTAGPFTAGPFTAGPSTAGPSTATPPADAPLSVLPDVAASSIAPSVRRVQLQTRKRLIQGKMHVTIQQGTDVPELEKCNTCCSMYHCPFCQPTWFKPTYYCKVKDHVEGHFNRAVSHEGYTIHRCGLQCRPKLHFHCIYCRGIIMRRVPFINHLRICKEKHPALMVSAATAPASPRPTAVSPFAAPSTAAHPSASPPTAGPSTAGPSTATPPADASAIAPSVAPLSTAPLATAPCAAASSVLPASAPHSASPPTVPIQQDGRMKKIPHRKITQKCPICHITFNKKNIKTHLERKHTKRQKDVTAMHHLDNECIDSNNGIYAVSKSHCGTCIPLHVQLKIWGENQHVSCESSDCQKNMEFAVRSGLPSHQCVHLRSIVYCSLYASHPVLKEETLTEMVSSKWFAEDKKLLCLARQKHAKENNIPLSVYTNIGTPQSKKYISIYEPTVSYFSRLGRVMVSYDTKKNTWHCPCFKTNRSCPHKYIAKWHLFETNRELFQKVRTTDDGKSNSISN